MRVIESVGPFLRQKHYQVLHAHKLRYLRDDMIVKPYSLQIHTHKLTS